MSSNWWEMHGWINLLMGPWAKLKWWSLVIGLFRFFFFHNSRFIFIVFATISIGNSNLADDGQANGIDRLSKSIYLELKTKCKWNLNTGNYLIAQENCWDINMATRKPVGELWLDVQNHNITAIKILVARCRNKSLQVKFMHWKYYLHIIRKLYLKY